MKVCVYGAGSIGGYLAVELALAGNDVCTIARGAHLEAVQRNGLRLRVRGEEIKPQNFSRHIAFRGRLGYRCANRRPVL